jgi:peptidoglycan/xylan/chitin deacetylase (PgdA/CDA1 family)
MLTQICITVDIEFSIGGAFSVSLGDLPIGMPAVTCPSDRREHGLGFILETLRSFGLTATFFVEALNYCYFGDAPMAAVAERILKAGHDVQLHLHPCWLYFRDPRWKERLARERPNDSCAGRRDTELDEMISLGVDAFRRWGIPRPVALRIGNLQADRAVYRAMARHGLQLASNIGCAIWPPSDPELHFLSGRHRVEGIVELPVLAYTDLRLPRWRHRHNLTITGCSSREIEILLDRAHNSGITPVVLLTHTFEFASRNNARYSRTRPHPTNQRRFTGLCRLIAENSRKFAAVSFSGGMPSWISEPELDDLELRVPLWSALSRLIIGQIDDRIRVR